MKNLTETQLINLIEGRLGLQSTRRQLDTYEIPGLNYSFQFLKSSTFSKTFSGWTEEKRKNFLKCVAGEKWGAAAKFINI